MKRNLLWVGAAAVAFLLLFPLPPGVMIGGIHMTKHTLFLVFFLVMLIAVATINAQGFFGPGVNPPPPGGPGFGPPPPPPGGPGFGPPPPIGGIQGGYGFTGPVQTVTVEQAKTFAHRTPVIVTGTIVQAVGGDFYLFRDSSGEIMLKIGPREWEMLGSTISPSDNIEISGELHKDEFYSMKAPEIHARYIRKL